MTDTCTAYVIPAVEKTREQSRTVWLVLDKDGAWFRDYTGKYVGSIPKESGIRNINQ